MRIQELSCFIINRTDTYFRRVLYVIISIFERLFLRTIGVNLGNSVKFRGITMVYRACFSNIKIGNNCVFNSHGPTNYIGMNHRCIIATIGRGTQVIIGNNVGISSASITAYNNITIGNNVKIGANCILMDSDFHSEDPRTSSPLPIYISDNVWLGANVVVKKGVTIGKNTVIAMNSVVTKSIPDNVVAGGTPCKVIKQLNEEVIKALENKL